MAIASGLLLCPLLPAQQGAVAFKNFKRYPASGQWRTEGQAFRGDAPLGQPQTETTCSSPLSPAAAAAYKKLGDQAAPMCRITVIADEERTAESEQVCDLGPQQQRIRTVLRAIDDRTIKIEVTSSLGGQPPIMQRSTARYLGACPAGEADAAAKAVAQGPVFPKPSAEDCAQLPEARQQMTDALNSCGKMPEDVQASCKARVQSSLKMLQISEQSCKQ